MAEGADETDMINFDGDCNGCKTMVMVVLFGVVPLLLSSIIGVMASYLDPRMGARDYFESLVRQN